MRCSALAWRETAPALHPVLKFIRYTTHVDELIVIQPSPFAPPQLLPARLRPPDERGHAVVELFQGFLAQIDQVA